MKENRKFERVTTKLRCWCEGANVTVYARIGNLSEGGLFLRTSTPLPLGSHTILRFGTEQSLEAPAIVVWVRPDEQGGAPSGMGLRFKSIDGSRRDLLMRIIESEKLSSGGRGQS